MKSRSRRSLPGNVTADASSTPTSAGSSASAEVKDGSAELVFRIDEPALWSPEEPNLYEGIIALRVGDTADVVSTDLGIREIRARRIR